MVKGELPALDETAIDRMTLITVKLTVQELDLLTALASDQLFRREFIDPKMPGYKRNPAELSLGKALVERLRKTSDSGGGKRLPPAKKNGAAV